MPNTKFSQLPVTGNVTAATIVPVVESGVNYQVSGANLQAFVNNSTGNITGGNIVSLGAVTATGNVSGSNAIITNGVTAATFAGSGAALTNLPGANVTGVVANAAYATAAGSATSATSATTAGTVTTGAQPNITSVGTLSVLSTSGNISAVGNIAGNYFIGNGAALTGIVANTTYNDSNVSAFLPTYTGAMTAMTGNVTTTGNVQGAYVKGNGSSLTGIVNSIQAGTGISISGATGVVTISSNLSGNLTGNLITGSNYIVGTVGPGGQVLFGDAINVTTGTSVFSGGLISDSSIEINSTGPGSQIGLNISQAGDGNGITVSVAGSANTSRVLVASIPIANAVALDISGSGVAKPYVMKVANVVTAGSGAKTLDGYIAVYIDGNLRYIPYYL
jgi:hypothetical protein